MADSNISRSVAGQYEENSTVSSSPAASEPTAHWPVCGPIDSFGDLNWPHIESLCYLTEEQTERYEKEYFFVVMSLKSLLIRHKVPDKRMAFNWDRIYPEFKRTRSWTSVGGPRGLSSHYSRSKKFMKECIEAHNNLARQATFQERAERTLYFLKLPRRYSVAPLDWPNDMDAPDRIVLQPLFDGRIVLTGSQESDNSASAEGVEQNSDAEVDDDQESDDEENDSDGKNSHEVEGDEEVEGSEEDN